MKVQREIEQEGNCPDKDNHATPLPDRLEERGKWGENQSCFEEMVHGCQPQ